MTKMPENSRSRGVNAAMAGQNEGRFERMLDIQPAEPLPESCLQEIATAMVKTDPGTPII